MTAKRFFSFVRALMAGLMVSLAASLGVTHAALAQDGQDVMNRLDRLERDIRTLNQQLAGGGGVPSQMSSSTVGGGGGGDGLSTRALVRLDALELEMRTLTGNAETLSYQIDQLSRRLDQLMTDLDFRLARLEGTNPGGFTQPQPSAAPTSGGVSQIGSMPPVAPGGAGTGKVQKDGSYQPGQGEVGVLGSMKTGKLEDALAAQPAPQAAQPAPKDTKTSAASVLPEGTPKDQYAYAFDLTRQARYDEAEVAFRAFLELHGKDELADNARYWLAETYYVRKSYPEAAQAFFEAYQKAPQGQKAADSLLKLGMTMAAMDKTAEACATFGKLRKEFSPLKANVEQTLNREVGRLKCK